MTPVACSAGEAQEPEQITRELYGLDPDRFTAERNARAKQLSAAGAKDTAALVRSLPKPVAAAWLVNRMVRARTPQVDELVALGVALRAAQHEGDGDRVRALDRQRGDALTTLVGQAGELAAQRGHPVGADVLRAVEETWRAASIDAAAARAVLSGRLVRPLSAAGFGTVDLTGVLAAPDLPLPDLPDLPDLPELPAAKSDRGRVEAERARAEQAAARTAARRAAEHLAAAERAVASATRQRDMLAREVERLEGELHRAQARLRDAEERLAAERARAAAARGAADRPDH